MNEQALKERIRHIANSDGRVFNQVWRSLTLERLLVRLSLSSYKKQFIFKGGLLLSHYITLGRETKDVDFLLQKSNTEINRIKKAFQEICCLDVEDGFSYTLYRIEPLRLETTVRFCYRFTFNLTF